MEFDIKSIVYVIGGVLTAVGALSVFAMKNPEAHTNIVDPRLSKVIGLLWAWSFGANLMGLYVHLHLVPLADPAKASEVDTVKGTMWLFAFGGMALALTLFAVQLWLHSIASDGRKIKQPADTKE